MEKKIWDTILPSARDKQMANEYVNLAVITEASLAGLIAWARIQIDPERR